MTADRIQRILVTDAHELAGMGAIRSLGRAGYQVTGLYHPTELQAGGWPSLLLPAAWSRHAQAVRQVPNPWTAQPEFAQTLLSAAHSGEFDALLPISEASLLAIQSIRAQLPAAMLVLMPAAEQLHYTLSKFHLNQAALRLGVPIPQTVFIFDGQPGSPWDPSGLSALRYPRVVKTDNHLLPSGEYRRGRTLVVNDAAQTTAALLACREAGGAVLVQEHIPGRGAGAFLLRAHGRTVLRFAHRRLHEVPYTGGISSLRESSHDAALSALAERLLAGLGYDGVAMVEFRVDEAGRPFLLEINGRLWGSLALALHAGVDFPLAMLHAATDSVGAAAPPAYPDRLRCRNVCPGELYYLRSVVGAPASELGLFAKAAAVAEFLLLFADPRVRHDYLWWSDPLPGVVQGAATARYLLAKQMKRPGRALHARRQRAQWAQLRDRALGPPPERQEQPVLFLCQGNICRSPFAAAYFNHQLRLRGLRGPLAQSAGFAQVGDRRTPALLRGLATAWQVELDTHRSQAVSRELLAAAGTIFVMDAQNYAALLALDPAAATRTYALGALLDPHADPSAWEIADPYDTSPAKSHASYQHIAVAIDALLNRWSGV